MIEGKIKASKLEFSTWVNQISIFDELPDVKALYMNRLLATGRNNFKKSFEKYNNAIKNSAGNMFGDAPTQKEVYEAFIVASLPASEISLIDKFQKK